MASSDLVQYQKQIQQLLPLIDDDTAFEQKLDELSKPYPASAKLLIKMEVKRLSEPCNKAVDLRGKVRGECRKYTLSGKTFWLDDHAINHYRKRSDVYNRQFTEGLREEILQIAKKNRTEKPKEETFCDSRPWLQAEYFEYARGILRKESRYKIASSVTLVKVDAPLFTPTPLIFRSQG
ncbi:hypothetical protein CS022_08680 [Veronia nyctiphanis]|uniref:Uncharacterized protein n=1 Tax=Veronia nyctiphanis TaxID=1278244 RepID=A0A4Q0YQY5_9GAMM|nr:hypothetical protein [Veronia nyctiphanis]RXJ73570.1 hypothetical protein CS022_08680 [Veronia nyctiphanis]